MIANYTLHESSDFEKGSLALEHLQSFENFFRKFLKSSDPPMQSAYLNEAERFMENACVLHGTIRCLHQRRSIEHKLQSVFRLAAIDGLLLRDFRNLHSWAGEISGVRKEGIESLRAAQEIGY